MPHRGPLCLTPEAVASGTSSSTQSVTRKLPLYWRRWREHNTRAIDISITSVIENEENVRTSDQIAIACVERQFESTAHLQFLEDVVEMCLDGAFGDRDPPRDLAV